MRASTLLGVGLAVAAAWIQAGCSKSSEPSRDAVATEKAGGTPGGGSGAFGGRRPRANSATLPEGTALVVRTTNALSTKLQLVGQPFTAHLHQPLFLDGREIVPQGAEVEGRIVESDNGGRVKGRATLAVQMTRLHLAGGRAVDISTGTIGRTANATKKKDALKIGIGSGVGAAIGAIAGGGKGAAIGAAAGAGAGTGVVLATHGDSAVIPSETVLHFALTAPVTVAGSR